MLVRVDGLTLSFAVLAICSFAPRQAQCDVLKPAGVTWDVPDKLSKGKDISGIACVTVSGQVRRCVLAVDEEFSGVLVTLDGRVVRQDDKIRLALKVDGEELDAEGAAYDPDTQAFYVIGSHGMSRHRCKPNPSSFRIVRIPIAPATGRPAFDFKGKSVAKEIRVANSIKPAMLAANGISTHVDKCLGTKPSPKDKAVFKHEQGANIEGIAIRAGRLFVGFRGPVVAGTAFLMSFDRDALFTQDKPEGTVIPVKLGDGIGVRDLAAVADGVLILSGPEDDDPGHAALHILNPASGELTPLGSFPDLSTEGKPEAILVLEETDTAYRLLVFSDSAENGAPTEFVVRKKH